ncbi:MAG: glycosyltransferase [Bacillota bacterium]|nr:glycosyltransferase [Bacillota bacterium]
MGDIQRKANESGYATLSIVGRRKPFSELRCERIGNGLSFWIHVGINTVFDRQGYGSYFMTRRIIRRLRQERPDIIHLHNLHGYYINLPLLFRYLSEEYDGKIFWTFHDCWPFTGHCAYFTAAGCDKWEKGCYKCPNKKVYPISLFADASKRNYMDKKRMFTGLKNLTIIVPSKWMELMVKRSFFSNYPVITVNNGIDLKTYSYRKPLDELYDKYGISREKKVILGVASVWDARKGMADFLALALELPDEYQILLVGLSSRQISRLPRNINGISRTGDVEELAMIYSLAHVFVNPSTEESFSLVTVEAIACGTPVIVLDTSAVKELVSEDNGIVLKRHGVEDYLDAMKKLEERKLSREQISQTAKKYDVDEYGKKIVDLYSGL